MAAFGEIPVAEVAVTLVGAGLDNVWEGPGAGTGVGVEAPPLDRAGELVVFAFSWNS